MQDIQLIKQTWKWLYEDLELKEEASRIARAFVKSNGAYAYE